MYVDKHGRNGDIWLTGSQVFHMMIQVSESLAGRVAILPLQGLSTSEIAGLPGMHFTGDPNELMERMKTYPEMDLVSVYERIFKGSMPRLYSQEVDRELYYSSYVDTYIQRDIHDLTRVGDQSAFLRFMTACAARTAQQINYADLARDIGISVPTAKQWLSILLTSGIVILLEPYFNNMLKRIVKSPKLYFMDTGLCCYLTRWDSARNLEASMMSGAIFETYVISEVVKSYYNMARRPPLFYYRDTDKHEIDLIVEANGKLHPFVIRKSVTPGRGSTTSSIRHFGVMHKTGMEIGTGGVISLTDKVYPIDDMNCYIPAWLI
jgi:predicted AAA+ superfamily ATPase